ncbi:putative mitochondrial protein [Phytophthora megakarya]|uniref:Putative mitochondrial protein n=1 Tax=Phytophthora megakarya TaxID=4795 RepID=A0A225WBT8_9STRA|nr:putative mitochondrial protein [Phytophthora megakarya]
MSNVRCALRDANLPAKWWPEAQKYMTYVQNCTPMSRLKNRTPYHLVKVVSPDVKTLQAWGCVCFAYVPEAVRKDKKLSARAIKCRFLGIAEDTKRYRLLDVYNKKHFVARSVTFDTENCASTITRSFTGLGFVRYNKEYCIYVQKMGEHWIIVVVYVDDLTIMSKDMRPINQLKSDLSSRFKMNDLGRHPLYSEDGSPSEQGEKDHGNITT